LKLSVLSKLSRSSSLLVSRYGKVCSKSPSSLSTRYRSCSALHAVLFNAILTAVCAHAVTLLGSNVKDQPPYFEISFVYGDESQFWLGHLPISGGIPACLFELFVLVFSCCLSSILSIGRDSFLSSVEMFEVFKVSFRILKVLCSKSFIFLSHNVLSLYVKPQVQQTVTVISQVLSYHSSY